MMNRRRFLQAVSASVLAGPLAAEAQPAGKVPRIGLLRSGAPPDPFVEAFRHGLRELGYVEGQNIIRIPMGAWTRRAASDPRGRAGPS